MFHCYLGCFLLTLGLGTAQWTFYTAGYVPAGALTPSAQTGQQPTASTKRYPVSGTVVNSITGAPVARAIVRVQGPEPAQAFTGDDGHFEIRDVPEGPVFLNAQRPGFQAPVRGRPQQVTVSSSTTAVQLKLVPQSSLRGRVRNSDGEPVEGLPVQVFGNQVMNGLRHWTPESMATTDQTGSFVIDDLAPGVYLVRTRSHPVYMAAGSIVVDGRHYPDLYSGQYFPNGPDQASAQPIQIQPGTDAEADFTVTAVPSYTASGVVANARNFSLSCENAEGESVSNAFRMERNGQFLLSQLPAGPCTLRARSGSRGEDATYGELPINVGSADLTGLQLAMESLPSIPVVITRPEGDASGPTNSGVDVQLVPRLVTQLRGYSQARQTGDGQTTLVAVTPGTYRAIANVFGGSCLGSMTSGNVDLLNTDLTVSAGGSAAPINVVLRKDCGSISVKVEYTGTAGTASILTVPMAAPSLARTSMFTGTDLTLQNLTPGDYMIYTPTDISDLAYAEPDGLKGISGQKVTVAPNAQVSVQVQVDSSKVAGSSN